MSNFLLVVVGDDGLRIKAESNELGDLQEMAVKFIKRTCEPCYIYRGFKIFKPVVSVVPEKFDIPDQIHPTKGGSFIETVDNDFDDDNDPHDVL